jgi:hypothetical protein
VIELQRLEDIRRAGLLAARSTPSLIEQVGVEDPVCGACCSAFQTIAQLPAGADDVLSAPGLNRLRMASPAYRIARRVVAVIAHHRQIRGLPMGALPCARRRMRIGPVDDTGARRRIYCKTVLRKPKLREFERLSLPTLIERINSWCGRPDSNRHRPCGPTDFLTATAYAASPRAFHALSEFVVWTIPSPWRSPGEGRSL